MSSHITTSDNNFGDIFLRESSSFFNPLLELDNTESVFDLFRELGWILPSQQIFSQGFPKLLENLDSLLSQINQIPDLYNSDQYDQLAKSIISAIELIIDSIENSNGIVSDINDALSEYPDFITQSGITTDLLPRRLFSFLLYEYLKEYQQKIFGVAQFIGVLDEEEFIAENIWEPVPIGSSYKIKTVYWDRIPMLFDAPAELALNVYNWSESRTFNSQLFLHRLNALLSSLHIPAGLYKQREKLLTKLGNPEQTEELRIPHYISGNWPATYVEIGTSISPIRNTNIQPDIGNGLFFFPYLLGLAQESINLHRWRLEFRGNARIGGGFGIELYPPAHILLNQDLLSEDPKKSIDGRLEVLLSRLNQDNEPFYLFGKENISHLSIQSINFVITISLQDNDEDFRAEINIDDFTICIQPGSDADGFLQKILAGINIKSTNDLGVGISNKEGFYFKGSSSLDINLASHIDLGPVDIYDATVVIRVKPRGFDIILGASISTELGPVTAHIMRIGLTIPINFPEDIKGNLGPVDIKAPAFLPPTGAGLTINADVVTGTGNLNFDHDKGTYFGNLTLQMADIGISATGLITTKLPDGSKGYSMLANIGVTFNPPFQLPYGFTLMGVGGLIAVNRSMDIEALRRGIKNRALDSILFPDPDKLIANASKIVSDMNTVFPVAEERYVLGPMVKIGWGSPNLITADVGIFLELPDPVRIVILGKVEALLPDKKTKLAVLRMDIFGQIDLEKQELTFESVLYNSKFLNYAIFGESALVLNWGVNPEFALSMGGFHPRFTPPAPSKIFADLKQISISINYGKSLQLNCRGYMAVTPNSVQFGSRVDLFAKAAGAIIRGNLNFDALFYLSPFSFSARINAGVQVTFKGVSLGNIGIVLILSGPTPWNARGNVSFKIGWFTFKKNFNFTWGNRIQAPIPAIDLWPEFKAALKRQENWSAALPANRNMVESLRSIEEKNITDTTIVVHPVGRLEVSQNVAPLSVALQKAGSAPIKNYDRFEIVEMKVGQEILSTTSVEEFFSRGQFENLSTDQKLSAPAFEKMPGGVTTASSEAWDIYGEPEIQVLDYESILIDTDRVSTSCDTSGESNWDEAQNSILSLAQRNTKLRAGPRKRFSAPSNKTGLTLKQDRFAIVRKDDLSLADLPGQTRNSDLTRIEAEQIRTGLTNAREFMVVPEYEVQARSEQSPITSTGNNPQPEAA
ncbi:MAG: hypothetical protein OEY38_05960 [Gammaproteobacteria bacterium]|nr:hypothetical protein [Gammaproteobacteria bacterium]